MNEAKTVLIVDDDVDICESISDVLSAQNFKTVTAYDGAQAIQKCNKQDFDLIITDLNMPKANGVKLIQTVTDNAKKNKKKSPQFIVISGDLSAFKNYLEKLDHVEILPKPFELKELVNLANVIVSGNRKPYIFKNPDEMLNLIEKIMAKLSNSLLAKEVNHQEKPTTGQEISNFQEAKTLSIIYGFDQTFAKIVISFDAEFYTKIFKSLANNERFKDKNIVEEFFNIIISVYQKSIEKKFSNIKIVDFYYNEGNTFFLKPYSFITTDTGDYKIYNFHLKQETSTEVSP